MRHDTFAVIFQRSPDLTGFGGRVKERRGSEGGKGRGREGKRGRREGRGGEGIGDGNVKVGPQAKCKDPGYGSAPAR